MARNLTHGWTLSSWAAPVLICAVLAVGCSGDQPDGTGVSAELSEWAITVAAAPVPVGTVVFRVKNNGGLEHEFVVVRTSMPANALPVDSGVVDMTAIDGSVTAELEKLLPGTTTELELDMEPGTYVLLCNLTGHYEAGMRAAFDVAG
jgi:uncharacterized cupredoxin-like copper-binding protein